MVTSHFEIDANNFAVDPIYSDDDLCGYADSTVDTVARSLGISYSLSEYRMRGLRNIM